MTSKEEVEQLIETIKQHSVIYDNTLPLHKRKLKEAIWEKIAEKHDMDVPVLKAKWKNLRDTYKKHLRSISGDTKSSEVLRNWYWAESMEFLRPHIANRGLNTELVYCDEIDDETNIETSENSFEIKMERDSNFVSDSETLECLLKEKPKAKKRRKKPSKIFAPNSDSIEYVLEEPNCLQKRTQISSTNEINEKSENSNIEINKFDGTELIFLGYAKTVKNMPLKRQVSVKMKIAKIIMEEELKCVDETEND